MKRLESAKGSASYATISGIAPPNRTSTACLALFCIGFLGCVQNAFGQRPAAPGGSWSSAVLLDSGNITKSPAISGPADVATAAWAKGQSSTTSLQIAQKAAGLNQWQLTSIPVSGLTLPPAVAESSDGTAIAGMSPSGFPIVVSRNGFNSPWSSPVTLSSGGADLWQLFLDGQDNAVALSSTCSSTCNTFVADRPDGGSWTTKLINPDEAATGAVNASGMMAAVFIGTQTNALQISVSTRTSPTGAWTAPQQIWAGTGTVVPQVAVAIDANGLVTVVWNIYVNGGYTLLEASQGQAGASDFSAAAIIDSVTGAGAFVENPAVVAVPVTGDVTVAWTRHTTVYAVETSYLSHGSSTWSVPVAVNTPSATGAGGPLSLAASSDGSLVALTWRGAYKPKALKYYAAVENPATHQWAAAALLSSSGYISGQPAVTCGPSATATAVWQEGGSYLMLAATYK